MPLYEEKLINPLALRYTQEHIRTTFRDKRPVEPTIDEIEVTPGDGKEYDVILRAPFPHIEIVRWSPPANGRLHLSLDDDSEYDDDQFDEVFSEDGTREHHWFTLDNRRLYCLQRAAVALLPKRAAAVVEILYADPGAVRRKYDSESQGLAVSMSQSTKCAPLFKWFWRDQVLPAAGATVSQLYVAHEAFAELLKDDARRTVDDLLDVPRQSSSASASASSSSSPSAPAACSTGLSAVERQGAGGMIAVCGGIDEEAADRLARFAEAAAAEEEERRLLAHAMHAAEIMAARNEAAPAAAGRAAGSRGQHAQAQGHQCHHGHHGHHGHHQHVGTKSGQATPSTTDGCQSEAGSIEVSPRTAGMPRMTSGEGSCDAEVAVEEPTYDDEENWEAPDLASTSGWWKNEKAAIGGSKSSWRHTLDTLRTQLEGFQWTGRRGDSYELSYTGEATWCCLRRDGSGAKKFTVSYDWEWNLIWWGTDQAFYSDAADLLAAGADEVTWYAAADWNKHKVRFAWSRSPATSSWEEDWAAEVKAAQPWTKCRSEDFAGRRGKHGTRFSAW